MTNLGELIFPILLLPLAIMFAIFIRSRKKGAFKIDKLPDYFRHLPGMNRIKTRGNNSKSKK